MSLPPYLVLDSLPFLDILTLCQVNKYYQHLCETDEYWQHRASSHGVVKNYRILKVSSNPKINYAWAMISGDRVLLDPTTAVYLSRDKGILFAGLEYVLGLSQFLRRAVLHDDRDYVMYGLRQDMSYPMFAETVAFAVEQDRKDLAWYIATLYIPNVLIEYDARYRPDESVCMYLLVKYGHFDMAKERISWETGTGSIDENLGMVFAGLLESVNIYPDLNGERIAFDLLIKHPNLIESEDVELWDPIGRYGSLDLIDLYIALRIRVKRFDPGIRDLNLLLASAITYDRVDIVRYLFDKYKDMSIWIEVIPESPGSGASPIDEIKSKEMYDLILEKIPIDNPHVLQEIYQSILRGGKYELIFSILDFVAMDKEILESDDIPELVKAILIEG